MVYHQVAVNPPLSTRSSMNSTIEEESGVVAVDEDDIFVKKLADKKQMKDKWNRRLYRTSCCLSIIAVMYAVGGLFEMLMPVNNWMIEKHDWDVKDSGHS